MSKPPILTEAEHRALLRESAKACDVELTQEHEDFLVRLRALMMARGPFGHGDQSDGRQKCQCLDDHNPDCGAHGFSVLALRRRYSHACDYCTMPATHFEPVHTCKHCGRTQDGPG